MEMGIDAISFILTHTRFKSHRFDSGRLEAIPVVAPITVLDRTPIHDGVNVVGQPVGPRDSRLGPILKYSECVVDEVRLVGKQYLTVRGWAISKQGKEIEALTIFCDSREVGRATTGLPRPDVMANYPDSSGAKPGFFLTTQLDRPLGRVVSIVARMILGRDQCEDFEVLYRFDQPDPRRTAAWVKGIAAGAHDSRTAHLLKTTICVIDEVQRISDRHVTIRGWAVDKKKHCLKTIEVLFNHRTAGTATLGLSRRDLADFAQSDVRPGFSFVGRTSEPSPRMLVVTLQLKTIDDRTESFEVIYRFP
jgi:hypothetical protein